ncbi:SIS domain-containing protein, partial [Dyadobacter sp.]|uniref:SIS domain-containing protein n=1 Tax=Dyadobacter sp. TaxID=1914288 RepID=UPI003F723A17
MIKINNEIHAPESLGEAHTRREILSQPALWEEVYHLIHQQKDAIEDFLNPILENEQLRIVLTGAGTSGYIGDSAQGTLQKAWRKPVQAVPTTEIVTQPHATFIRSVPTLLISFARSGNSPESVETVKLADQCCDEIYHLIITCNNDGALAHLGAANPHKAYCIILPEATNDKSLAMTSSFTCMLLTALLVANVATLDRAFSKVQHIVAQGKVIFENKFLLESLVQKDFERVV